VKITTMLTTAVAAVVMATVGIAGAPTASAYPTVGKFGSELTMVDSVGQVGLSWTVSDLRPSTDTIPDYPVTGKVWEATATVKAIRGSVTPAIPQFNARAADGTNYRVLWQANTPNGISGATIAQGQQSTGKIYFDVTGAPPTTVALNNGMEDLLVWDPSDATPPPPPPVCTTPYGTYQNPNRCTTFPPYPYGPHPYG
jgi:Domain of unknown function (DUF1942)